MPLALQKGLTSSPVSGMAMRAVFLQCQPDASLAKRLRVSTSTGGHARRPSRFVARRWPQPSHVKSLMSSASVNAARQSCTADKNCLLNHI